MIQGFTETDILTEICTEDNRINTAVNRTQIRFLVKFINDFDGSISYSYSYAGPFEFIFPRYTKIQFYYAVVPNLFLSTINLLPAGHWKYEIYEVSWIGQVVLSDTTAPKTETQVLPVADNNGVVNGIVTKGILNLTEKAGTEQVQYNSYESPPSTNYVYFSEQFLPTQISSLNLWYQHLEGLQNQVGVTDPTLFIDSDLITWESQIGSNLLYNDENWNKVLWSTAKQSVDINNDRYYEVTTTLTIPTDFTLCISVQFKNIPNQDGLYGSQNLNIFEAADANTFKFRAGGTSELSFTNAYTLIPDNWYTVILQRDAGVVSVYVDAGNNSIIDWGSGTDADTMTINTIGSWNGDAQNLDGYIRDLSYFTQALTSIERQSMVEYINNY